MRNLVLEKWEHLGRTICTRRPRLWAQISICMRGGVAVFLGIYVIDIHELNGKLWEAVGSWSYVDIEYSVGLV